MDSGLLFVSSYARDARSLVRMLEEGSFNVVHARCLKDATNKLKNGKFRIVVTEANLEDGIWLDLLELTRELRIKLVVTNPWTDARFWAEVINLGADDVLAQPFQETEVRRLIVSATPRRPAVKAYTTAS